MAGNKVYVQVKTARNPTKEYTPNDGSRLPNFGLYAMSEAIISGEANRARYIVFTTGKGLHFSMDKMSRGMFEVVAFSDIKKLMNNDIVFLNKLRISVGLKPMTMPQATVDPEFAMIKDELENS
jgi:hypothetical protein